MKKKLLWIALVLFFIIIIISFARFNVFAKLNDFNSEWILAKPKSTQTIKNIKRRDFASQNPASKTKQLISKKWCSPIEYQKLLGSGVDVDWAEFKKIIKVYSLQIPKDFKKMGFNTVRIRVRADSDFNQIDRVIKDSLDAGLIPVLAFSNHSFELDPDSDEKLEDGVEWWKTISERLRDKDSRLSFNLMIEVSDALNKKPDRLNLFYKKAIHEIRKTNPNRIILISPRVRSYPEYLNELKFPENDDNIMVEFHFYASGPDKKNPKRKWTNGSEEEKNLIRDKIKLALKFQDTSGYRVWVGAWMAGNYNKGNNYSILEQEKFATFVVGELRKAKIPYAVNAGKFFYDYEKKEKVERMQKLKNIIIENDSLE